MRGTVAKRLRRQAFQQAAQTGERNQGESVLKRIVRYVKKGSDDIKMQRRTFSYKSGPRRIYRQLKSAYKRGEAR